MALVRYFHQPWSTHDGMYMYVCYGHPFRIGNPYNGHIFFMSTPMD